MSAKTVEKPAPKRKTTKDAIDGRSLGAVRRMLKKFDSGDVLMREMTSDGMAYFWMSGRQTSTRAVEYALAEGLIEGCGDGLLDGTDQSFRRADRKESSKSPAPPRARSKQASTTRKGKRT